MKTQIGLLFVTISEDFVIFWMKYANMHIPHAKQKILNKEYIFYTFFLQYFDIPVIMKSSAHQVFTYALICRQNEKKVK